MKKSLIALAVAGVFAAPAFAATSNVDVYGIINIAIEDTDGENTGGKDDTVSPGVVDNYSRIGFKGSEDLGGGLKAIYQIEIGINPNDTNNNLIQNADTFSYRNTFVGLAGGWGTALMGRHDTPLKISTGKLDLFADTLADMNATVGFQDLRADNVVAYISPSFGGFTLAGAVVPAGGSTALGTTNTESAPTALSTT